MAFRPSPRSESDLNAWAAPFITMFIGNDRARKSPRANQVLCHTLTADGPFGVFDGSEPIITEFQYDGPLKSGYLSQVSGISLPVDSDWDVFIIHCKGLHSLSDATPVLKHATFVLSQRVRMTALVMSKQVYHEVTESVRS
jgi:hypothetical protein